MAGHAQTATNEVHRISTRAMSHPHILKHRDTSSFLNELNSTETNRKNAGTLLRLISDDFNTRKFPELVAPFRTRSLSLPSSLGAPELERGGGGGGGRRWRVATDMFVFLRRLGHNTFGSNPHPLPDREERSREGEGDAPDQS